ncbi:MAG: penicillin-binding protein 2 [Gammaproteobacteria bacterium]|jgi:penicillin-binding protein 2
MSIHRLKDHWREQRMFLGRVIAAAVVVALLAGLVMYRLVDLQVVKFEHFSRLSQGNRVRLEAVPPVRGLLFDRAGRALAENRPSYQLELIPEQVEDLEQTLAELQGLGLVRAEDLPRIRGQIRSQRRFEPTVLRARLSDEEAGRFAVHRPRFPGVDIQARLARQYPLGAVAAHAIGYVGAVSEADLQRLDSANYAGTAQTGKIGAERAWEDVLHGTTGVRQLLVNAQGRTLQELERTDATPGRDVHLTLDLELQALAEEQLGDRRGAVVALDPRNGHVLALASTPAFDPNLFSMGISSVRYRELQGDRDQPLFNRALRGQYPPGSTIKPMLALGGLHYGLTTPSDTVYCPGWFSLPNHSHRYRDWKREGHGTVDLEDSVAQSCDVYFYRLAVTLGIDRMHDFLALFGLGIPTGIDIPGERDGLLPSREWKRTAFRQPQDQVWFPGETVITGIGQGYMLATPLQLAQATAILATRGRGYRPTLLAAIEDPVTGVREESEPLALPPLELNPAQVEEAIDAMIAVVHGERGTARAIGLDSPWTIAGKTGTAQVVGIAQGEEYDEEETEERHRPHALFIAFAPAENPRIALSVLVENGASGSTAAAPVARALIDNWLAREAD